MDTGFSNAALSESEARMLGLTVAAGGVTGDMQGGTAPARTAVADRMTIGDTVLRDVPLIVYPDTQPPWNELPAGRRGALGLPVAVALQTIGWTTSHTCQIGAENSVAAGPRANLAFDQASLIARARFGTRPLDFVLDTGNQGGTQLWSRFARDFPALVRDQGRKSTKTLEQIGGAKQQDIVVLPEAHLGIGTFDAVLRPAEVFGQSVGDDAASRQPGNERAWAGQGRHHRLEGHAPDPALTAPGRPNRRTIRPIPSSRKRRHPWSSGPASSLSSSPWSHQSGSSSFAGRMAARRTSSCMNGARSRRSRARTARPCLGARSAARRTCRASCGS